MTKPNDPTQGQWTCATCSRVYGRRFAACAYCVAPFLDTTPAVHELVEETEEKKT